MAYVLIILLWGVIDNENETPVTQENTVVVQIPVLDQATCLESAAQVKTEYGVRHAFCVHVR